jgi:hypothetical protein
MFSGGFPMKLEIDATAELTNTRLAPLAVLCALYQSKKRLEPLQQVQIAMQERRFSHFDKLVQVLLTLLAGCQTLSEANSILKPEQLLAEQWGWAHFADQSSLSRTLDALSLKQLTQLRTSIQQICRPLSQIPGRDWRAYLWLDFDLTGLPCGPQAELSQKGYFSDKKSTRPAVSPGQCHPVPGKSVVRSLSRQLSHGTVLPTRRARHRNCFRLSPTAAQADRVAHGWGRRQ